MSLSLSFELATYSAHRHLHRLVDSANLWKRWGSVQQLSHHSLIRDKLLSFWVNVRYLIHPWVFYLHLYQPCRQHEHESLRAQHFVIRDDESDLLCHLLYCGKKLELFELPNKPAIKGGAYDLKESEQVVELLWQVCNLASPDVSH